MLYQETDCTIEHEGKQYTAGGAYVTLASATFYVGADPNPTPVGTTDRHGVVDRYTCTRDALTWHGEKIGTVRLYNRRRTRLGNWTASYRYSFLATIDGVQYSGTCYGSSMSATGYSALHRRAVRESGIARVRRECYRKAKENGRWVAAWRVSGTPEAGAYSMAMARYAQIVTGQ